MNTLASTTTSTADVQAATLKRFLDAWNKWDAQEWLDVFTDDFTQVTMPFSLGIPTRSRAQAEEVLPALVATVKSYELTVHNIIHDAAKNKAAVYALSKGDLPWGPWEMEYSAFITFSEAGDKVSRLEEMLDSNVFHEFGPRFGQYLQANGGPTAVAAAAKAQHDRAAASNATAPDMDAAGKAETSLAVAAAATEVQ